MPPHCDSMDGPVVKAAKRALAAENVNLVLPYVAKESEHEVEGKFERAVRARKEGSAAREVADLYFYETVVRLHRAGEGAAYTGLKPAGLAEGSFVPVAEAAVESGSPGVLLKLLTEAVQADVKRRFDRVIDLRDHDPTDVAAARAYVQAMLGFVVNTNKLYEATRSMSPGGNWQDAH